MNEEISDPSIMDHIPIKATHPLFCLTTILYGLEIQQKMHDFRFIMPVNQN